MTARKLPADSEVAALNECGWTQAQIAERYGVNRNVVFKAIARWKGRPTHDDLIKKVHDDERFTRAGKQPVEHRDTGEGFGFGKAIDTYRVRRTSLNDCDDLLREWGVR